MFSEGSSDPSPPHNDNGEGQGVDHKHNHDNGTKQKQGKQRDGRMPGGHHNETPKVHAGSKKNDPRNKPSKQAFGAHQDDKRHREMMAEDRFLQQQRQLQRSAEGQELYT